MLGAFARTAILGPLLLPWLPGRAFSIKGAILGLVLARGAGGAGWLVLGIFRLLAPWRPGRLILPAIASFTLMNFTGATTFTSLSGVLREMRFAVPAQIAGGALGLGLWVAGLFLRRRAISMRYLESAVTLEFDPRALQRLRDVRRRLPARGLRPGEQAGRPRRPRRLHGVRRLRAELRARGDPGALRGRLRGGRPGRSRCRNRADLRVYERFLFLLLRSG